MAENIDRDYEDRLIAMGVYHLTANHLASLDPVERSDAMDLAQSRQHLAATGSLSMCPPWDDLTNDERAKSTVEALHWLRAARRTNLAKLADDPDGNGFDDGWDGDAAAGAIAEALCDGGEEQYDVHVTHPDVAKRIAHALRETGHLAPVAARVAP